MTVSQVSGDRWSRWLFDHRFGRSEEMADENMGQLYEFRERVLSAARLSPGDTVLDVGSGDGFIAAAAVPRVAPDGHVIFSDISASLLDHCREDMEDRGQAERCSFVETDGATLAGIEDASVDAVTSRSTLCYLADQRAALANFVRVLRPGGRLSVLEPIARYGWQERSTRYMTWDMAPLGELGDRLDEQFRRRDTSTTARYSLTERDLVLWAEEQGTSGIHLDFTIDIGNTPAMAWQTALEWAPNPCAPTLGQVLDDSFDDAERAAVAHHLRPLVEAGDGLQRQAIAHLTATR